MRRTICGGSYNSLYTHALGWSRLERLDANPDTAPDAPGRILLNSAIVATPLAQAPPF